MDTVAYRQRKVLLKEGTKPIHEGAQVVGAARKPGQHEVPRGIAQNGSLQSGFRLSGADLSPRKNAS